MNQHKLDFKNEQVERSTYDCWLLAFNHMTLF